MQHFWEYFDFFSNRSKAAWDTRGTIRTIIVTLRARKSKNLISFLFTSQYTYKCVPGHFEFMHPNSQENKNKGEALGLSQISFDAVFFVLGTFFDSCKYSNSIFLPNRKFSQVLFNSSDERLIFTKK